MKSTRFIPIAALAFAAACSDTATSPTSSVADRPQFLVAAGSYTDPLADAQTGIQDANAPSGGHLTNQSGDPTCLVNADFSIDCSAYAIGGVGHTNAFVSLEATWTATIDCINPAGGKNTNNPIESHEGTFSDADEATLTPGRNGTLRVGSRTVDPASVAQGCPNANWRPEIREGSIQLVSFTYSLHFDGFAANDFAVFIQAS
jgi:hypothetical protein